MKVIDMHTHVFPPDVAPRAIQELEKTSKTKALLDGTIHDLLDSMQRAGISKSALMPIATKPNQVASINAWTASQDRRFFIPFGTLHPRMENLLEAIAQVAHLGLSGVKLHPNYQDFAPDDPIMNPLYEALVQHNLILLIHAGADLSFDDVLSTPHSLAAVSRRFPSLRIIAAHFGGWKQWDEVDKHLISSSIYLDTSYTLGYLAEERFVEMSRRHGIEKVLFGTDSPWTSQDRELEKIRRLPFEEWEKEYILYRNACTLLGLSPDPGDHHEHP